MEEAAPAQRRSSGNSDEPQQRERRQIDQTGVDEAVALFFSEEVVQMLQLLDYEKQFCDKRFMPVTGSYWAYPAGPSQLKYFLALVEWLLKQLGRSAIWSKYDDPNTACTNIVTSLQELRLGIDAHAAKLTKGYGDAVCNVLHKLTQHLLKTRQFKFLKPSYPNDNTSEAPTEALDDEDDICGLDDIVTADDEIEEDNMAAYGIIPQQTSSFASTDEKDDDTRALLNSQVDPQVWALELERVAPKLKIQTPSDSNEWRVHHEQSKKLQQSVQQSLPTISSNLKTLSQQIHSTLERIKTKEDFINTQLDNKERHIF
eukprot:GHVL01009432.1.p1 GENE.GHVL01009432.1~~GHVL01009432.1.p1  ORF type:complete len:315 (+),score=79.45 GHVL01009432.1:178-1122(+)